MAFDPSCIDVLDFLECLEIENVDEATTEEVRFSCPFPMHGSGDEKPSAYMNRDTTAFYCHSCHEKGNALHFTQKLLDISPLEAIRMLKQRYQPGYLDPSARSMVSEVQKILDKKAPERMVNPILPPEATQKFEVDWDIAYRMWRQGMGWAGTDYIFSRGFLPATLKEWEFGFDEWTNRICFAVRDEENELVGFKGRAWHKEHEPKYLVLGDSPGRRPHYGWSRYYTSSIVFGLNKAAHMEDPYGEDEPREFIICEGELNAIALWQAGFPGVAVNGSNFSERQARLLRREADAVTVFFDSDSAGNDGTMAVIAALKDFMPVFVVPDHESDPADMTTEEIVEILDQKKSWTLAAIEK